MQLFGFDKPKLRSVEIARVRRRSEFRPDQEPLAQPHVQRIVRRRPGTGSLVVRHGTTPNTPPSQQPDKQARLILAVLVGVLAIIGFTSIFGDSDSVETGNETALGDVIEEPSEQVADQLEEENPLTALQREVERVSRQGVVRASPNDGTTPTPTTTANEVASSPELPDPVSNVALEADFIAENGAAGAEQTIGFRSTSIGEVDSVSWDFGDGATGSGLAAFHTYGTPGSYSVTMTAYDSNSSDSVTYEVVVPPNSGRVEAVFTATVSDPARSQTILFANTSHPSFESFYWDFGDGNTSTERQPTHSYQGAGDYAVLLSATTADGVSDSVTYSIRVSANGTNLDASFSAFPSEPPNQQRINFRSTSSGAASQFDWDYGDGNRGSGETPDHTYASPGTYTVTLTIRNNSGRSDSTTQEITVQSNG